MDWASTSATAIGQSQQQALEAAGTFGNLFTALKIGGPAAATMSTSLVNLAGDLASFNNVSPQEALDALRSGLTGETEPLKRFGVNMNEATLKAKAMELGISKGTGVLDPAAKAQAAYALIMEQTTTAQGDFARTSDGLANQQRIMAAQFENTKANLGTALLPVMTQAAGIANSLVSAFNALPGPLQAVVVGSAAAAGGLALFGSAASSIAQGASAVAGIGSSAPQAGRNFTSGFLRFRSRSLSLLRQDGQPRRSCPLSRLRHQQLLAGINAGCRAHGHRASSDRSMDGGAVALQRSAQRQPDRPGRHRHRSPRRWLRLALEQLEGFRNFWIGLWDAIQVAVEPVVSWVRDTVVPWLSQAWATISQGLQAFWGVVQQVWGNIQPVIATVIGWIQSLRRRLLHSPRHSPGAIFKAIGAVVGWVWGLIGDKILW